MLRYREKVLGLVTNYEKRQQVLFNLELNGEFLCRTYTPEQVILLNDDMLAQNSPLETKKKETQKRFDDYQTLLQTDFLDSTKTKHLSVIRCGRCGKGGVTFTTKQISSADEGSTTFCACSACGNRWKMS